MQYFKTIFIFCNGAQERPPIRLVTSFLAQGKLLILVDVIAIEKDCRCCTGAQERTRTSTTLRSLPPQGSASAISPPEHVVIRQRSERKENKFSFPSERREYRLIPRGSAAPECEQSELRQYPGTLPREPLFYTIEAMAGIGHRFRFANPRPRLAVACATYSGLRFPTQSTNVLCYKKP